MNIHESVALIYNFGEWGTFTCCCKPCCDASCRSEAKKKLERKNAMTAWFETHYFDEFYHSFTSDYFDEVLASEETSLLCEVDEEERNQIKEDAKKKAKEKATAKKEAADIENQNGNTNGAVAAAPASARGDTTD